MVLTATLLGRRSTSIASLARALGVPPARLDDALRAGHIAVEESRLGPTVVGVTSIAKLERLIAPLLKLSRQARMRVTRSTHWVSGFPELVAQWHRTKNASFPDEVTIASRQVVWWKCPLGPDHEWSVRVFSRKRRASCPFCAGSRVSVTNCLATRRPDLARQWHPSKNQGLSPKAVTWGSSRYVWWKCPKGPDHEWRTSPNQRHRFGCPFCDGKRVARANSLAALFPRLARQWHRTKNGTMRPENVAGRSARKVWWKCPKGVDHEWCVSVSSRSGGNGCPFCAHQRLSVTNSLATFPEISRHWHPTKNGKLRPEDVIAGTDRRVWWKCRRGPDHEWQAVVAQRTHANLGCPFCSNHRTSATRSLDRLRPDLAREWHPRKNGKLKPTDVTLGSATKVWWRCHRDPRHVWIAPVRNRAVVGTRCPRCIREHAIPWARTTTRRRSKQ